MKNGSHSAGLFRVCVYVLYYENKGSTFHVHVFYVMPSISYQIDERYADENFENNEEVKRKLLFRTGIYLWLLYLIWIRCFMSQVL